MPRSADQRTSGPADARTSGPREPAPRAGMAQPVSTDDLTMSVRVLAQFATTFVMLITLLGAAGCNEETGVKVTSMTFHGVTAVKPGQLKSVLATGASSKLPWGEK